MQLKKRYTLKKHLAVGAMTVVMLASSLPALANEGNLEGSGRGHARGLGLGLGVNVGIGAEIRDEIKTFKQEIKLLKSDFKATASASATAEKQGREELRVCKAKAKTAFEASVKIAAEERDAAYRNAGAKYLAELKAARNAFHLAIGLNVTGSASGSSISASATADIGAKIEAIKTYRAAVKKAQKSFAEAKRAAKDEYRKDVRAAQSAREAEVRACEAD